jgi:hypothetical protein
LRNYDLLLQIWNANQQIQENNSPVGNSNDWITWGTIAVACATIILVFVTGYYAVQTKRIVNAQLNGVEAQLKSVDAIKESTQAGFRPYIQIDFNFRVAQIPLISIFNAGKGTAISIEITYKIKELEKSKNLYKINLIFPGKEKTIYLDTEGYKQNRNPEWYRDNPTTLEIEWKCKNILNNEFKGSDEIYVSNLIRQRQNEYGG